MRERKPYMPFVYEKRVDIMLYLLECHRKQKETYLGDVWRRTNIATISGTQDMMLEFNKNMLIEKRREGRKVFISLTEKGIEVAEHLLEMVRIG